VSGSGSVSAVGYDNNNSSQYPRNKVFETDAAVDVHLKKVLINELLAYISFYRNRGHHDQLQSIVRTFFSNSDIADAKKLLVEQFGYHLSASSVLIERRTTTVHAAHEAELEDIFGALDLLDMHSVLSGCHFIAHKLDLLPKYGPEELNIDSGVPVCQIRMEDHISKLAGDICQLKQKIDDFSFAVNDQLNKLNTNRVAAGSTPAHQATNRPTVTDVDRSMNLIVFGVDGDRSAGVWRNKIGDILNFMTDRDVDVMDTYRIARYAAGKCRPVLVKLHTVWDRRVVLSCCSKLKNYPSRVFISPDEPPEARRKRVYERITTKAEHDSNSNSNKGQGLYSPVGRHRRVGPKAIPKRTPII